MIAMKLRDRWTRLEQYYRKQSLSGSELERRICRLKYIQCMHIARMLTTYRAKNVTDSDLIRVLDEIEELIAYEQGSGVRKETITNILTQAKAEILVAMVANPDLQAYEQSYHQASQRLVQGEQQ